MTGGLIFSPAAKADFEEIYDYSVERWNLEQAERYVLRLHSICLRLASGELAGRDAGFVRRGYYKQAAGSHFIFYKLLDGAGIEVVRILHQRMDVNRHLS